MEKIQQIRNKIEQEKGIRSQLQKEAEKLLEDHTNASRDIRRHEQSREIIREVGLKTQQELQFHISDITSLSLEAVFNDPYELVAEFVQRRNKTECDLYFKRDGVKVDPISASGGGAVDIAAFALRIAAWSMKSPKSRNTIILDEPFKFLDGQTDRIERASQMVKELSEKLNLQFIIISHIEELTEYADKIFSVKLKNGISKVTAE